MKRCVLVALMAALFGMQIVGCKAKVEPKDDDATLKVDTKGENKSIKVNTD